MTATGDEHTVRIEHHIAAAPPHTVYRAWPEPGLAQRWMAPGDQEVTRIEIDEPPGGRWRTWKAGDGAIAGGFDSELLELVPGRRLVFRWGIHRPAATPGTILQHAADDLAARRPARHHAHRGARGPGRNGKRAKPSEGATPASGGGSQGTRSQREGDEIHD